MKRHPWDLDVTAAEDAKAVVQVLDEQAEALDPLMRTWRAWAEQTGDDDMLNALKRVCEGIADWRKDMLNPEHEPDDDEAVVTTLLPTPANGFGKGVLWAPFDTGSVRHGLEIQKVDCPDVESVEPLKNDDEALALALLYLADRLDSEENPVSPACWSGTLDLDNPDDVGELKVTTLYDLLSFVVARAVDELEEDPPRTAPVTLVEGPR